MSTSATMAAIASSQAAIAPAALARWRRHLRHCVVVQMIMFMGILTVLNFGLWYLWDHPFTLFVSGFCLSNTLWTWVYESSER